MPINNINQYAEETKFRPPSIQADGKLGEICGYASLFGQPDMRNDVVMPGAFFSTLLNRRPQEIRMLFQHDPTEPVGVWHTIQEDQKGLFVAGRIARETQRGQDLTVLLEQGAIDGLSIGFKTVKAKSEKSTGNRLIVEADLWEISIVTFPMLSGARIQEVKSGHPPSCHDLPSTRQFEKMLMRDAGLSKTQAQIVIAKGFRHLIGTREAAKTPQVALAESIRCATAAMTAT